MAQKYLVVEEHGGFCLYQLVLTDIQPTWQAEEEPDGALAAQGYTPLIDRLSPASVYGEGDMADELARLWIHNSVVFPPPQEPPQADGEQANDGA